MKAKCSYHKIIIKAALLYNYCIRILFILAKTMEKLIENNIPLK